MFSGACAGIKFDDDDFFFEVISRANLLVFVQLWRPSLLVRGRADLIPKGKVMDTAVILPATRHR